MPLRNIFCKNGQSAKMSMFFCGHTHRIPAIKSTSPLDYMIDKYCRLASVEKIDYRSFHSLRRAFGTELAMAEVPVTSISQMLGHSDMSADKAYLSFNKTQTSLCSSDFRSTNYKGCICLSFSGCSPRSGKRR